MNKMAAARIYEVGSTLVTLSWFNCHRLWKIELDDSIVVTMEEQQEVAGNYFAAGAIN
jgi:hypothetical protein